MRRPSGAPMTPRSPTTRSSLRSGRAWRSFPMRCCWWGRHRMHVGVCCGTRVTVVRQGWRAFVWQAATRVMNPSVPQRMIDEATERDPARAAAEFGAQFRTDIESFVSREAVMAVVRSGVGCAARFVSEFSYVAFVDPSGGYLDSMTLGIAHAEGKRRSRLLTRTSLAVLARGCGYGVRLVLKRYGMCKVMGDRYAGEWPREASSAMASDMSRQRNRESDIYGEMLPRINSGEIALLDNERLISQLVRLERRTARGGRDSDRPSAERP